MLIALAASAMPSSAQVGRRIALVVGNSAYESIDPLNNAAADAQLVAATLADLGFEVTLLQDATLAQMKSAVADTKTRGKGAEAVLFYYSGHGFQLGGRNFLVPKEATLRDRARIEQETLQLSGIMSELADPSRVTMFLIDACRNNPLPPGVRDETARDGLAQVEANTKNMFVMFSTGPGTVASDGTGENGPFALALRSKLTLPEMDFSRVMRQVRADVDQKTGGLQVPWEQHSMTVDFQFNVGLDPGLVITGFPPAVPAGAPGPGNVATGGNENCDEVETGGLVIEGIPANLPTGTNVRNVGPDCPETATGPAPPVTPGPGPPVTTSVASVGPEVLPPIGPEQPAGPPIAPPVAPEPTAVEVAMLVQTELKRIGCYSGKIDGEWGAGSRGALQRYFDSKKLKPTGTEPTLVLKTSLATESGTICKVVQQGPKTTKTTTTTGNNSGGGQTKQGEQKKILKITKLPSGFGG